MATVQRWVATTKFRNNGSALFRAELSATVATCDGVSVYEEPDTLGHPGEDSIEMLFDVAPADAAIDAAIAAFPRSAANIGATVALVANTPEHITTLQLSPGDHISINVYVHVSLILSPTSSRDEVLVGLAPVWRETDGTVRWGALQFVGSGQVAGFSVDLSVVQLDAADVGVALSLRARASGDLVIVGIQVTERTRKNISA